MMRSLLLLLLLVPATLFAQPAIPEHGGVWVHDEAGVLSAGVKGQLEAILKAERDSTSNQIAVLIIPSLKGAPLEEYSLSVAEKWKLGKKDTDNGILLLISMDDKQMRIEVGLGQEGALTDAMSRRITRNEIVPRFRTGDYDGGVSAGVISIIQVIRGQYKNTDPPAQFRKSRSRSPWTSLIIIAVIIIAAMRRRGGGGGRGMGGYWAAGSILGSGLGGSSGSWSSGGGGGDYGGGGSFGGGGSSDSW